MFLEEGLDPLQSVFDLHIPDSSALLDPDGKTELGHTRGRSLRPRKGTKADGFFSCGSYQSESLARTFDLPRSTFRAHVLNKFGTHLLHIRYMLLKPIDKTFEESLKSRSIEPSDISN